MTLTCPVLSFGQSSYIDSLESILESSYGLDRLKILIELNDAYREIKLKKAVRYGRQATEIGTNIIRKNPGSFTPTEQELLLNAYFGYGQSLFDDEDYLEARTIYMLGLEFGEEINNSQHRDTMESKLIKIEEMIESGEVKDNFFNRTITDLKIGQKINNTTAEITIATEIELAESQAKKGNFQDAIGHYEKAINLLENKGDQERITELKLEIAFLLDSLEQYQAEKQLIEEALRDFEQEEEHDKMKSSGSGLDQAAISAELNNLDSLRKTQSELKELADKSAKNKDYEKALEYYRLYESLTIQIREDSIRAVETRKRRDNEIKILKQQKEISELRIDQAETEREKQIRIRNISLVGGVLTLVGLVVALYFYILKRRQHKMLGVANSKLASAEKKITALLNQQVSADIAKELRSGDYQKEGKRHFVCVMFLDIRDFTPLAQKLSPEALITYQNDVFGFIFDIVEEHNGIINQLMGDGFMATFGAPVSHGNNTQNAFNAALDVLKAIKVKNEKSELLGLKVGIGLHNGNVVAGNVGNSRRQQYSITGNAVIVASRIEQLNKTYNSSLIISENVFKELDNKPEKGEWQAVNVKGIEKELNVLIIE